MNRREFIAGAVGIVADFATLPADAANRPVAHARVTVDAGGAGTPIASDFVGLSYESGELPHADFFSADNRSVIALIRRLGADGVIRIGGNSSERTLWRASGLRDYKVARTTVTPADIDRLKGFLDAIGWKLIYGLDLATGTAEDAASEAEYVARTFGPRLMAFQLGNEPDLFGGTDRPRSQGYDVQAYLREWRAFFTIVRNRVPGAPFAGPDVAYRVDWLEPFADQTDNDIRLLTYHYYDEGPAEDPTISIERLLRPDASVDKSLREMRRIGAARHLPFRLSETNSVFNGGRSGVSDTLAAAIWGADLMFRQLAAGSSGINFHSGRHRAYSPIALQRFGGPYYARPLYYGMLLFAEAARGHTLPARCDSGGANFTAYAARDDGTVRVTLINKDTSKDVRASIKLGRYFRSGHVLRLTGPTFAATDRVTLGGSTIDETGAWAPTSSETVRLAGSNLMITIPAVSAATVALSALT